MARALPLYLMAPGASFVRTTLAEGALSPSEVAQCIEEAMEPLKDSAGAVLDFVYLVPGHPLIWPKLGYIDFISSLSPCPLSN